MTWSSGEQFDTWSSATTTESDQLATDGNVWQLFQAHQDIEITDGTVDGLGIATTATAPNSFDDFFWYAAVSTADETIGSITDITTLANVFGPDYTAGGLFTSDPIATVAIPAGRYFVIGQNEGPTYRAVRTLAASRTAVSGGVAQFTAINRVYYSQQQPGSATTLPTQIGGTGGFFTQLDGHALVMSIRFTVPG